MSQSDTLKAFGVGRIKPATVFLCLNCKACHTVGHGSDGHNVAVGIPKAVMRSHSRVYILIVAHNSPTIQAKTSTAMFLDLSELSTEMPITPCLLYFNIVNTVWQFSICGIYFTIARSLQILSLLPFTQHFALLNPH